MMKKAFAITCSLLIAVAMLVGCTTTPTTTTASGTSGTTTSTSGTTTAATTTQGTSEPVTLVALMPEQDHEVRLADTPNFKQIQQIVLERWNIDYQIETAMGTEMETVVTTRLAAGTDLPDLIYHSFTPEKLLEAYASGSILRLNDLIEENGPDIYAMLKSDPFIAVSHGDAEGNILRVPHQFMINPQHRFNVISIREDFLDAVNMERPYTPDEFYNALKAFADQDVNGTGRADTVFTPYGFTAMNRVLGAAFGIPFMTNAINSWYADSSNKVYHTMLLPETKEYVEFVSKLYTEGLLDNNFMNKTGEMHNNLQLNNQIAAQVGYWWDGVLHNMQVRDKGHAEASLFGLIPPLAKEGVDPFIHFADLPGNGAWMLTKDCADPAKAITMLNWGYTMEGTQISYFGEASPGSEYYRLPTVDDPRITLPDYTLELNEKGKALAEGEPLFRNVMGWNLWYIPRVMIGNIAAIAYEYDTVFVSDALASDIDFNIESLTLAVEEYQLPAVNFTAPMPDQRDAWGSYADLWLYMDEMLGKFMTGTEPIANWDAFVTKCNEMDIEGATKIQQERHDAYLAIEAQFQK